MISGPSIMEPIPENDSGEEQERLGYSPGGKVALSPVKGKEKESKSVKKEVFCTEKVESTKRLVAEDKLADLENRYYDPSQLGPVEMTSTTYKYSYESTCDPLPSTSPLRALTIEQQGTTPGGPPKPLSPSPGFIPSPAPSDMTASRHLEDFTDRGATCQGGPDILSRLGHDDDIERFYDEKTETKEQEVQNGYLVVQNDERVNVERQLKQTEKVTRVTKVTTTRTVQHLPVDERGSMGGVEYRIITSPGQEKNGFIAGRQPMKSIKASVGEEITPNRDAIEMVPYEKLAQSSPAFSGAPIRSVPSEPGAPQIVDIDSDRVTIVWLRPEMTHFISPSGHRVPFLGYQVHYRPRGDPQWYIANEDIIAEPLCTIENLNPNSEYELRVVARNANGFGPPSQPTVVQLRPSLLPVLPSSDKIRMDSDVPSDPGRPRVIDCDGGSTVRLCWEPPIFGGTGGPVIGYRIEYRPIPPKTVPQPSESDWLVSNDKLTPHTHYTVTGLRPNGDYEFRVIAKNADGFSPPSKISDIFRIKPYKDGRLGRTPPDSHTKINGIYEPEPQRLCAPSRPIVIDFDSDWATLAWHPSSDPTSSPVDRSNLHFVVECREAGHPVWYQCTQKPIFGTQYTIADLHKNATYEFRVVARNNQGFQSRPSVASQLCQLRPKSDSSVSPPSSIVIQRQVPAQPRPPEILAVLDDCVTLCWVPAKSNTPLQGYQVEFRDCTEPPHDWLAVNAILTHSSKMTIGDLVPQRQYEFRVTAKNAIGYSKPSEPSQPVFIGALTPMEQSRIPPLTVCRSAVPSTSKLPASASPMHREYSFASDVPLPVEMSAAKESPPITDTDDSPPPIRRKPPGADGVTYRDPTLPEVLDYLTCSNNILRLNATGYLQHLTYNDEAIKHKVRELDGIPRIIELLRSDVPEIQKNACGCLRNLSFGIDENKKAILNAGGVPALSALLKKTPDMQILEEISSVLWNLSSHDDLKASVLEHAMDPLVKQIVVPYSGWSPSGRFADWPGNPPNVFRNATGVLRNVSCDADGRARRQLRSRPGLVDALLHFLHLALDANVGGGDAAAAVVDGKSVENVICLIRNLCYRLQEMEDPDYEKKPLAAPSHQERSKSAPSSPKHKHKTKNRREEKDDKGRKEAEDASTNPLLKQPATGIALTWQPEAIRDYLKQLDLSSNPDTLEGSAGTIQNLAACYWKPSVDVRAAVRKEKGLPILVRLLAMDNDRVVCAAATALRNLSLDQRNKELIGKYAMEDLVIKLPPVNGPAPRPVPNGSGSGAQIASDETIAAVLSVIYATTVRSPDFSRILLEKGGVERLIYLSNCRQYSHRVVKYAAQVLFAIWQHKELHDAYKKAGFREDDFASRVNQSVARNADTLARPVSTRGAQADRQKRRQRSAVRPDLRDDDGFAQDDAEKYATTSTPRGTVTPYSTGYSPNFAQRPLRNVSADYDTLDARMPLLSLHPQTPSPGPQSVSSQHFAPAKLSESTNPTYAQIQKRNLGSGGARAPSPAYFNGVESKTALLSQTPQQPMDSWV